MSTVKPLMTLSAIGFALLFGGGVYLFMNMDIMAKNFTERVASDALGVPVTLGSFDISLKEKKVSVSDIRIANPDGFKEKYAATVDTVDITLGNVYEHLIHFKDIGVTGTTVNLEVQETRTNLMTIKNGIKKKPAPEKSEGEDPAEQVKVIIDSLAITGSQLVPANVLSPEIALKPVGVADITLTGIGKKENGVLAREAIAQIWTAVANKVNVSAAKAGLFEGISVDALQEMGVSHIKGVAGKIGEKIEKLGDGIKGIFGE